MKKEALWSLRLGFSTAQQHLIEVNGIDQFIHNSFAYQPEITTPDFLRAYPKKYKEIRSLRREINQMSPEGKAERRKQQRNNLRSLGYNWIERMQTAEYPLRENMTCFWHNHFVSTSQKVKIAPWIHQHYTALSKNAFGNFRDLTKAMVKSNAMISYLDNDKNRKNANNENLGRELLELFTLGIGHYTEDDVKNAARALAGLSYGDTSGRYRNKQRETDSMTFLGQTGVFDSDTIVDIIFEQEAAPYLITEKILKWFIYDDPSSELVKFYGDYLQSKDFEIQPLLEKIFLTEFDKNPIATKVKDPLRFALQTINELNMEDRVEPVAIARFLRDQSMELYNQPNVKGWEGGNNWLTSAIYLQRNQVSQWLTAGERIFKRNKMKMQNDPKLPTLYIPEELRTNKEIISYLLDQNLSIATPTIQEDLEQILTYDFKPHVPGAELGILRAYQYIITTPEYQVI